MSKQAELTEQEFVRQYNPEEYQRPSLTADILVLAYQDKKIKVLLVQRRAHPFKNHWACPGGFVELGENPVHGARRELKEETGLHARWLKLLGAYGAPGRDPRTHIVSLVYYTAMPFSSLKPCAGDDARAVRWFNLFHLPRLAFDHNQICRDMRRRLPLDLLDAKFAKMFVKKDENMENNLLNIYRTVYGPAATPSRLKRLEQVFHGQRASFPASIFSSL